jgi:hypothetical protein
MVLRVNNLFSEIFSKERAQLYNLLTVEYWPMTRMQTLRREPQRIEVPDFYLDWVWEYIERSYHPYQQETIGVFGVRADIYLIEGGIVELVVPSSKSIILTHETEQGLNQIAMKLKLPEPKSPRRVLPVPPNFWQDKQCKPKIIE